MDLSRKIKLAITEPNEVRHWAYWNMEDLYKQFCYKLNGSKYHKKGFDIFEESWDNLIILDSCRFDTFHEICDFDGNLESRISKASMTEEFIRGNFSDKRLYDTVYVAGNYWYMKAKDEINSELHKFIAVEQDAFDGDAAFPETVTKTAIRTSEIYPNKRLIIHYNQPHQPYFDRSGELFRRPVSYSFELPKDGYEHQDIIHAYRTTLETVLRELQTLLSELKGRTVITADHGELLGERLWPLPFRRYGHPRGFRVEHLLKIPWFIIDDGERKDIIQSEPMYEVDETSEIEIDKHLRSLGYRI
jgi:hypothetical protein